MISKKISIKNPVGLHLRPAGVLCNLAMNYQSKITFQFGETTANAKSVLSVLGACIRNGDEVTFVCEGPDECEAMEAILQAVENGLGETLE